MSAKTDRAIRPPRMNGLVCKSLDSTGGRVPIVDGVVGEGEVSTTSSCCPWTDCSTKIWSALGGVAYHSARAGVLAFRLAMLSTGVPKDSM